MATPLDVITLQQAKDFLVIDFPDRDAEITRHIKAAIGYIERYTNHMLYQRELTYGIGHCGTEIYEYPIEFPAGTKTKQHVLSVTVYGEYGTSVSAEVGYATPDLIPEQLIEAAYKMLQYLTENHDIYTATLPWDIQMMCNMHRRSPSI